VGLSWQMSFRLPKSSPRIWWQVDLLICRTSANMRNVPVRSSLIMSLMCTTLSSLRELEGRPDLVTSSDTLPKMNRLCHPNTHAQDKASSLWASCRSRNVSVTVLPSFTQNLMLTRCSTRTSILLTAKIANGKGDGVSRRVLPPSRGRVNKHKYLRRVIKCPGTCTWQLELHNIYLSRDIKSVSKLYGQRMYNYKVNTTQ